MTEPVYDIPAFAKRLDIGLTSAYKLVRTREVRAARAGKLIRITESEVMEFLRGRRNGGGVDGGEATTGGTEQAA